MNSEREFRLPGGGAGSGVISVKPEGLLPEQTVTCDAGMGKGLSEPCSPYRTAVVFGALLNTPNADGWNCLPQVLNQMTSFNVSTLQAGSHEVVVALANCINPTYMPLTVDFVWKRKRDDQLLYSFSLEFPGSFYWVYAYSYIGYVPWEIWEDGDYYVNIILSIQASVVYVERIDFTISGVTPPPTTTGSISKKEITYGGNQFSVPASDVPLGQDVAVRIGGTNNTSVSQQIGIAWVVRDPDGETVESCVSSSGWPYVEPGVEQPFVGTPRTLNKLGNYTIYISLLMDEAAPQQVDEYDGVLCTVVGAGAAVTGDITYTGIKVDSIPQPLPASGIIVGNEFRLRVDGKNTSDQSIKVGLAYRITKPSGVWIERYVDELGTTAPGGTHSFDEGPDGLAGYFSVDEPGEWTVVFALYSSDGMQLLDTFSGVLFTAEGAPPTFAGEITDVQVEIDPATPSTLPASGVEITDRFLIHVWGKNTSDVRVKLGISYTVTKPDNTTIQRFVEEFSNTGSGETHHFVEGPEGPATQFTVDQEGEWSLSVDLYGEDNILDSFSGVLFAAAAPTPPATGGITEVTILYGTDTFPIESIPPVSGVTTAGWFKIKMTGQNPAVVTAQLGMRYIITKPDSTTIERAVMEAWPYTGSGESHTFIEGPSGPEDAFAIDQIGEWKLYIELLLEEETIVVDTWQGAMFDAARGLAPITELIPMLIMVMVMGMMMNVMEGFE